MPEAVVTACSVKVSRGTIRRQSAAWRTAWIRVDTMPHKIEADLLFRRLRLVHFNFGLAGFVRFLGLRLGLKKHTPNHMYNTHNRA